MRRLHNALLPAGDLVGAGDDAGAAVVGTQLGQIGDRLHEVAVVEAVEGESHGLRPVVVPRVAPRAVVVVTRGSTIDRGLRLGHAHRIAHDLLRHANDARMGRVLQENGIGFEQVVEVVMDAKMSTGVIHGAVVHRLRTPGDPRGRSNPA